MANMSFGVNILPKADNTYYLGNGNYRWRILDPIIEGTPTAPTAATGTNSTQIANTAFVQAVADLKANKTDTVLLTTLSRGRQSGSTVGQNSLAFGVNVSATGENTVALGNGSSAAGTGAFTVGTGTKAKKNNQYVFGKWNIEDNSSNGYVEIIGNGTDGDNRSDARLLDWAGNQYLSGEVFVNSTVGNEGTASGTRLAHITEIGELAKDQKGGYANGLATLNSTGKIPTSQLPDTFMSLIVHVTTYNNLPATGDDSTIYITEDTGKMYRWTGSEYMEVSGDGGGGASLGTSHTNAFYGDYGNTAYLHATESKVSTAQTNSNLYKITVTGQGHIASLAAFTGIDLLNRGLPLEQDDNNHLTVSINRVSSSKKGNYSIAYGDNNIAADDYTIAVGTNNTIYGNNSVGTGTDNIASANDMYVGGAYNNNSEWNYLDTWTADTPYEVGDQVKYTIDGVMRGLECTAANSDSTFTASNWDYIEHGKYVQIIGNGTADNARSNAYALDWDGNGRFKGNVYINCNADGSGGTQILSLPHVTSNSNGKILIVEDAQWTIRKPPTGLPTVSSTDNNKILIVQNGVWAAAAMPNASGVSF